MSRTQLSDANEETSVISASALAVPEASRTAARPVSNTPDAHVNFDTKLLHGSQLRCIDPPPDSVACGFSRNPLGNNPGLE